MYLVKCDYIVYKNHLILELFYYIIEILLVSGAIAPLVPGFRVSQFTKTAPSELCIYAIIHLIACKTIAPKRLRTNSHPSDYFLYKVEKNCPEKALMNKNG